VKPATIAELEEIVGAFSSDDSGRSVVLEVHGGHHIHRRAEALRPGASLLKLPLVLAVADLAQRERIDLDQRVRVSELPSSRFPSVLAAFDPAHAFSLRDLARLALLTSDNRAAQHLVERVGIDEVNHFLRRHRFEATTLVVGFDDQHLSPTGRRNVTTAAEAARLIALACSPATAAWLGDALHNGLRDTRIRARLPEDTAIANKTGSLDGVVNDVAMIHDDRRRLTIAVLCDRQVDSAITSREIALLAEQAWAALG
jgi:beta-lactamase class A